ncbi:MAG: DUF4345 domain-containing protein [Rhizobiaceae bacterium]|nr:DUF4345 domain-containing protein [Rhizobiaceae bacterium]
MKNNIALRTILVLIGAVIMLMGVNVGAGGMRTLGWQISPDFITIKDAITFGVQDNHIRFIGGVWFGVGAAFLIGGVILERMRGTLIVLCGIIAVAGLFRLSALDMDVIFSADIAPSLALELIAFPLLAYWLSKSGQKSGQK